MPSPTAPSPFDLLAPPAFIWGPWASSPFFFGGGTKKVRINLRTISSAPSSFDIEIKYIDKNGKQVIRREPVNGSGSIEIEAGGDNDIHQVHVRVRGHTVGQIIRGDFDLGLTPIPDRSSWVEPSLEHKALGEPAANLDRSIPHSVRKVVYQTATASDAARMTSAVAQQAIEAAKANDALGKLYVKGDRDTVSYMHALHRAAYPELGPDSSGVGEADRTGQDATRSGGRRASAAPVDSDAPWNGLTPWMSDATAAARKALTDIKFDNAFVDRYLDGDRDAFNHVQGLIRTAYPEPDASGGTDAGSGTFAPMFRPWSPKVATESQAPWMQEASAGDQMSAPGADADAEASLASWAGYRKPDWRRGS